MANLRRANGREQPWRLPYFGVGNENWGCGGSMRPEYYADLYRQYQTYVRHMSGNSVFKIACGPNRDDYHWTEVMMREATRWMDGLSLHYYTVPGRSWHAKGSATEFGEDEWFVTLQKCLHMDVDPRREASVACAVQGAPVAEVTGSVLSGDEMRAHNTFQQPARVAPAQLDTMRVGAQSVDLTVPPMSVVALSIGG